METLIYIIIILTLVVEMEGKSETLREMVLQASQTFMEL